jgi:hypothetical protein
MAAPETSWNIFRNPDIDARLKELNILSPVFYKMLEMLSTEADATQARFDWGEDDIPANADAVNHGGGYSAVATSVVVDDATKFVAGDILRSMTHNELILVSAVTDATNTLTIVRGHQGSTAAILSDDEVLLCVGNQLGENDTAPASRGKIPAEKYNYCQMFSRTFEVSELQQTTDMRYNVGTIAKETLEKAFTIRRDIANAFLYGKRYKGTNQNSKTYYSTGGFYEFATSNGLSTAAATLTWPTLYGWLETPFIPTASSARKTLLCGQTVAQAITKIAYDKTTFAGYNEVLGQQVNILRLPSGKEVEIVQDPYTFNTTNGTQAKGILIDTAHIGMKWKSGWRLQWKQNVQNNNVHGRIDEIYGMAGLVLANPTVHGSVALT